MTAINAFTTALSAFARSVRLLSIAGIEICENSAGLPTNVCVSPFNDGRLGTLCSYSSSCGNTSLIGVPLGVVTTAYNTLISSLAALDVLVSPRCATGYVCKDIASVAIGYASVTGVTSFGFSIGIGYCQCDDNTKTCGPRDTTPFGAASNIPYPACTPAAP
ncbi:hypothetical protein BCF74_10134 [Knoellia remsis]|uniref:Uncharacterized protein n=1 Tax=Knoellia remsis TaxID=407159 RepID=A0A2T0V0F3_9MICO|nr:hypothetical protein [Knoellia remsis]PRY63636.1 hypothetical protein BCF74_10134 [Knoellia remsis]